MSVKMLWLPALLAAPLMAAFGGRATYVGGTIATFPKTAEGRLETTNERHLLFRSPQADVSIPYDKINLIEYGQRASRRYALAIVISPLLLLSKKRAHFVTIGYLDERGIQQAMVLRLDKDAVRPVLASLEAKTGLKIQYQDEEARRAGRG